RLRACDRVVEHLGVGRAGVAEARDLQSERCHAFEATARQRFRRLATFSLPTSTEPLEFAAPSIPCRACTVSSFSPSSRSLRFWWSFHPRVRRRPPPT